MCFIDRFSQLAPEYRLITFGNWSIWSEQRHTQNGPIYSSCHVILQSRRRRRRTWSCSVTLQKHFSSFITQFKRFIVWQIFSLSRTFRGRLNTSDPSKLKATCKWFYLLYSRSSAKTLKPERSNQSQTVLYVWFEHIFGASECWTLEGHFYLHKRVFVF